MWLDLSKTEVGDTLYLASPSGWCSYDVTEWTVARKTKSGQIVCRRGEREMRLTARGRIIGAGHWSRERFVSAETAAEMRAENAERERFHKIKRLAEAVAKAARDQDSEALRDAFAALAQGLDAKRESPVGSADAPDQPSTASTKASTNSPGVVDSRAGEQP